MSETTATKGPSADDKPIVAVKPTELPSGKTVKTDPNKWYYLRANYTDKNGKPATSYAFPLGINASTSFWDYVVFGYSPDGAGPLRFSPQPAEGGWYFWKIQDDKANSGYHLDCKATGFLYRTNLYNTWWQIVDGKLYCSYWTTGVPAGNAYYSFMVPSCEYLGMGLPSFTCELIEA